MKAILRGLLYPIIGELKQPIDDIEKHRQYPFESTTTVYPDGHEKRFVIGSKRENVRTLCFNHQPMRA